MRWIVILVSLFPFFAKGQFYLSDQTGSPLLNDTVTLCESGPGIQLHLLTDSSNQSSLAWSAAHSSINLAVFNPSNTAQLKVGTNISTVILTTVEVLDSLSQNDTTLYVRLIPDTIVQSAIQDSTIGPCDSEISLSPGIPYSGEYWWASGLGPVSSIDPSSLGYGNNILYYRYTDQYGCVSADSTIIQVSSDFSQSILGFEIYGGQNDTIDPILYNGVPTYSICSSVNSPTFGIQFSGTLLNYASYSISWGDGAQSVGTVTSTTVNHQYTTSSLYQIIVELTDSNNCTSTDTLAFYYGTTQSLGLGTPGNTTTCFDADEDSIFYDFQILFWELDPVGITYEFSSNDGTSPQVAFSPLVTNGVSNYPFLIYDASSGALYYRHWFTSGSCGYSTDLAGVNYSNVFAVNATKSAPCNGSQSSVAVGPILVSSSPNPFIALDTTACINDTINITVIDTSGAFITSSGTGYVCDGNIEGVWFVKDDQGFPVLPSPSTYSVVNGTSMGDTNTSSNYPSLWTYGTNTLSLVFHQTGNFSISKLTGFVNTGSNNFCDKGNASGWICVDSIPQIDLITAPPDTLCSNSEYLTEFEYHQSFCGDSTEYKVEILDSTGSMVLVSSDTTENPIINISTPYFGKQVVKYQAFSACGTWSRIDTIFSRNNPKLEFSSDTVLACADSLEISIGFDLFSFTEPFDPDLFTGMSFSIAPSQDWTLLSNNSLGLPTVRFDAKGTYVLELILEGVCRTDTLTTVLNYGRVPDASFTLDSSLICTSTYLILDSIADTTGIHQWIVKYGNSTSNYIGTTPMFDTLSTAGVDTVFITHTITTPLTCRDSVTEFIVLPERLYAEFIIQDSICSGQSLNIGNLSTGEIVHYNWTLDMISGDSIMVQLNNPKAAIPTLSVTDFSLPILPQQYLISLSVYDKDSCLSTAEDTLMVFPKPNSAAFIVAKDTLCYQEALLIFGTEDFGGIHNWSVLDSTRQLITFLSDTIIDSLNTVGLVSGSYSLIHQISIGENQLCDSTFEVPFYIAPEILISLSTPNGNCSTDTIPLYVDSVINPLIDWSWFFPDTTVYSSPSVSLKVPSGEHPFLLTGLDQFNCSRSLYDTIQAYEAPNAQILSNSNCSLDSICRADTNVFYLNWNATNVSGSLYTASWDWTGDSVFDAYGDSASFAYINSGSKSLWVRYSNEYGCEKDSLIPLDVKEDLFADINFSQSEFCGPYQPVILDSTFGELDSGYVEIFTVKAGIKQVLFSKGYDQNIAYPTLPSAFDRDTTYIISLTLWNCCETVVSFDTLTIKPLPVASLYAVQDTGCSPFSCTFQPDGFLFGGIDSAYLDFGDGQGVQLVKVGVPVGSQFDSVWQPVSHNYIYQGVSDTTYIAKLYASNACNDTFSTLPINVQRGTVLSSFSASKTSGCAPLTVDFFNLSYNYNSYAWCFDYDTISNSCDTTTAVLVNPSWTFTDPGSYTVALFVNANCGRDTSYMNIDVFPSPEVSFVAPPTYCGNDTIAFTNNSNFSNGNILGYLWTFGDGDSSLLSNPTHVYDSSGFYQVILTAFADNGCKARDTSDISILPTPQTLFTANSACLGDTVFFSNSSTIPVGQIVGYTWEFGDGNTSNALVPYHVYSQPGVYKVSLKAVSNSGCESEYSDYITISPLPTAEFNWALISSDSCSLPQTYQFLNTSTNGVQFAWDFDFANSGVHTSVSNNPQHTFTAPGSYLIQLYVENQFGCWDTIFKQLDISEGIDALTSISSAEGCMPLEVSFYDISNVPSNDIIQSVEYVFGDGVKKTVNTPPFNITYTYQKPGTFTAYTIVTSMKGCTYISPHKTILVHDLPYPDFSFSNTANVELEMTNLTVPGDTTYFYEWNLSTGQNSFEFEPIFQLPQLSTNYDSTTICLFVESAESCSNSLCKDLWIWQSSLYVPNAFAPDLNFIGEDNRFLPKGHNLDVYELWIYDKWGNLVFYSDKIQEPYMSPAEGWNGLFMGSGDPLPMGVYSWRINASFLDNKRWNGQMNSHGEVLTYGTLTLLR